MERTEIANAIEAILFAAAEPLTAGDLKKVFERYWDEETEEQRAALLEQFKEAVKLLRERWSASDELRGFSMVEVAGGFTFRSHPRYARVVQAMRAEKPQRLSKAALETLAIIAYRQPTTKPEVDHIRGVDCGGTIRMLLERNMVRIVGKKEEPGRPMLYGTTKEFLSFFSLEGLTQLPSLREYHELNEDSMEELQSFDGESGRPSLQDLSASAKKLQLGEEPAVLALDEAVNALEHTEHAAKEALAAEGITFDDNETDNTNGGDGKQPSING